MIPCWVTAASTLLLAVQALALAVYASDAQPPMPRSTITLDLAKAATSLHHYDGHGAIADSGSSRLLMDYPEPQRSEILDYLFLPNFGASLHMLKVEVNGDVQSGIGTGPSHMHHRHDSGGCNRGNTAWLIREVKKRNPSVLTYGLPWGMPAWIGGGDYYSQDSIDYFISWLRCQREAANTTVDFLGLWNEPHWRSDYWGGANYTKSLRRQLNAAGFEATKLVLLDDAPQYSGPGGLPVDFLEQFASDAEFRGAVEVVGYHYCCDNIGSDGYAALSAIKPTIRVWESEAHDGNWDKTLVTSYNNAHKTAQVDWCAIWSAYYPEFVDGGTALFWAFEPWSGHYVLDTQPGGISQIWKGAHFTQFTEPGWRYLDGANGNLSATGGGAFLALTSDVLGSNFSIMIETHSNITCTTLSAVQQTVELVFSGEWCPEGCALQMWVSNATHDFLRQPDLQLAPFAQGHQRTLNLELPSDTIFSISTLHTARKGQHPTPPARVPFPFPFITDFEAANDTQPKYVSDNSGSFSIETGVGKGDGSALKQRVTMNPDIGNGWINNQDPVTQFGSHNWTDYSISVDAMIVANQTMDGYADVPTAAALMPCVYGSQNRWTFSDSIISQNQTTCLSSRITPMTDSTAQSDGKVAWRRRSMSQPTCDVTNSLMNLQLMDCKTPQASNCGKFDLNPANRQLKHRHSGLCVTACGAQPWGCGDARAVSAELAGAQWSPALMESVALLKPCQPGMHTQQWKYDGTTQSLMSSTGKCLSTEARQPSIRPPYTSVCSRFYFMWGNNGAPQKGYCLEAYVNGSWILRGAGLPYLTKAAVGSEAEAVHGQYLLLQGALPSPGVLLGQWHALRLNASGTRISGYFNGVQLFSENNGPSGGIAALSTNGAPALASSFHEILFDNLRVEPIPPPTNPLSIVRAVSIAPGGVSSVAFSPECLTPAGCTSNAQYSYESGLAVRITNPVTIQSLGRWRASFGHQSHHLRLYNASGLAFQQNFANRSNLELVGNASVDLSTCEPDDIGFCYSRLLPSLTVGPGVYFILSEEDTVGDVVFWGKAMAAGGVRLAPMDGWVDQNEPRSGSGNNGTVRLAGPVAIVNGSGSWTSDGADTTCHDTASLVCKNTTNTLCVSCTSSDWLAPSCPPSWNFQAECCATWTRQCAGVTPNLGFSAFGPVSALLDSSPTIELN